jgi:hypothetical protein
MCPDGISGVNCETVFRNLYANTYVGNKANKLLVFSPGDTANFSSMNLTWQDSSVAMMFPIMLSKHTSGGSTFVISSPVVKDTLTFTGYGTVSQTNASLNLKTVDTAGRINYISLNNYIRQ